MEYIDVYDENGKKTNIVRSKNLVYKTGSWHRSVHIWIMNSKGQLLIQKRAQNFNGKCIIIRPKPFQILSKTRQ